MYTEATLAHKFTFQTSYNTSLWEGQGEKQPHKAKTKKKNTKILLEMD